MSVLEFGALWTQSLVFFNTIFQKQVVATLFTHWFPRLWENENAKQKPPNDIQVQLQQMEQRKTSETEEARRAKESFQATKKATTEGGGELALSLSPSVMSHIFVLRARVCV